jgi:L-ascorbate metabolism protein UlaG (beta-lactamase superfamily)
MNKHDVNSILIIDDHPLLRRGISDLVSMDQSFQVIAEASNGTEGLELALSLKPDIILLSHLHLDHLHIPSLKRLPHDTPLIVPRGSARWLGHVLCRQLIELSPGDEYTVGDVTIHVTFAEHGGNMPVIGLAQGYLLEGEKTVYFPGDTDVFPQMSELAEKNIDLALIPIWGWGPTLGAGHLDPESAAEAVSLLHPKHVIPIHWASFRPIGPIWEMLSYLHTPGPKFTYFTQKLAPETQIHFLEPGETFVVPD